MKYFVVILIIVIVVAIIFGINPNPYFAIPALFGEGSIFNRVAQSAIEIFGSLGDAFSNIWDWLSSIFS